MFERPNASFGPPHWAATARAVSRRRFLSAVGAGAVGVAMLAATGRGARAAAANQTRPSPAAAPAFLQGVRLSLLNWTSFVPDEDTWFQETLVNEWAKPNRVDLSIELVSGNDLQPKVVAALQAGAGPDVMLLQYNWAHLYAERLQDVSEVAEPAGVAGGGYYPVSEANCKVNGVWRSVPFSQIGVTMAYRESILRQYGGTTTYPADWETFTRVATEVKRNKPDTFWGQTVAHTFGDAPQFCYPFLWAHGASDVDETGKNVTINSDATELALTTFRTVFENASDLQCLSWDDSSNNRAYLAGQIWTTQNGASIYIAALRQAPDIAQDTDHALLPAGPKGRFLFLLFHSFAVPTYARDTSAAKDLLRYIIDPANYRTFMQAGKGFSQAPYKRGETDLWPKVDPKLDAFKDVGSYNRWYGYPGPPTSQAVEAASKFIIVDMFASVVQGTAPREAIRQAESELRQIYR